MEVSKMLFEEVRFLNRMSYEYKEIADAMLALTKKVEAEEKGEKNER